MRRNWRTSLLVGLSVAWAGALSADQLPGRFVPDTPVPEAMRGVKVIEPKRAPKAEQDSERRSSTEDPDPARGAPPGQAGATADIWQPQHAGEQVEHATGRPEHRFKHGPDSPGSRAGIQGNNPAPIGIVRPTPGLIVAPRAKPQPMPGEQGR